MRGGSLVLPIWAPSISAFGVGYDPMRRDRAVTHDGSVRMNLECPESEFGGVMMGRPGETMCRLTHREADSLIVWRTSG